MFKPTKVHSLAKELGLASKDITDFLKEKGGVTDKKHMTDLEGDHVELVINHFVKANEVKSLEEYVAAAPKKKPAPKKPAAKAKPAEAEDKKEAVIVEKEEKVKQTTMNETAKTSGAPKKPVAPKAPVAKKPIAPKAPVAKKPIAPKAPVAKKAAQPSVTKLTPVGAGKDEPTITQNKKTSSEDGVLRVDTKSTQVNLDKYNERYEKMAGRSYDGKRQGGKQRIRGRGGKQRGQKQIRLPETEAQKKNRLALEKARKQQLVVQIPEAISVGDLAERMKRSTGEVIKKFMGLGVMATINEVVDYDTAALIAMEFGAKVEREIIVTTEEKLFDQEEDQEQDLVARAPVVVVMGHVDHGKTSLLDAIRHADVIAGEAGGITQHIGAYQVSVKGKPITFLDTPGHAAFTSMRARGADITDIAILVVAADDGVMPQTIEAINHARAAEVEIIVAINKIDKPSANPDRILQELSEYGIVPESWGGDTICVPISAKRGDGIDELLEMIELTAEVQDLKANPNRLAQGVVIEAQLDRGRGPVATVLVQNGTLRVGDPIIVGTSVGRVRAMQDDKGNNVSEAGPSTPVEVIGLSQVPAGGDILNAVENEKLAKELAAERQIAVKEFEFSQYNKVTLDNLFSQIEEGEMKELPIIVKADVKGSAEAVKQSLEKLENEEVRVRVIHSGAGAVNESDVMLANASGAIIIGFNVRPEPMAEKAAEDAKIDMHMYRVIYDAIDDVENAMKGMLAPKYRDVNIGRIEVRTTYKVSKIGTIAGCFVLEGKVERGAKIRVVRDGIVITEDEIKSLKRFKDDAKEVKEGYECGIGLENYNDVKEGDIFEAFITEEYRDE